MAKAIVDPVELRRFAQSLKRFNSTLQDQMRSLQGQLASLGDTWRDQEHDKFREEFDQTMQVLRRFMEAANEQASDIHIEAEENSIRIRYRLDGLLQTQNLPPEINRFQAAIISRIKIMARLNIAEKRLPQDGRIKMRVNNREIDVPKLLRELRDKHHLVIDGGYGKLKSKTFRLSNMGDETEETVAHLLACLDDCLG